MIEKYKQCDATIVEMMDQVSEIERRLAEQEPVSESANGLRNQINTVKVSLSRLLFFSKLIFFSFKEGFEKVNLNIEVPL